ncbi:hypothetical protein DY000_02007543 [Brassica cretica]|uniref:Uncharacterized protein n=1 Tax=Brassica cretica TaxID=69181 RepID=A0ABQ7CDR7_BRACR|nr:hypothetical protein DY000_02007543 [Brassica cretica]
MNPELLSFPSSLVGGHPRPRRPFTDPFSFPIPSWGDVPEADYEAVPMVPRRRLCSCFFDDGPRSEIREGDLTKMRRKYVIHPSVGMRSLTEFERFSQAVTPRSAILGSRLEPGGGVGIQRFYDRSGDLSWNPEDSRDWTLRSCKNMGYPFRSGDRIRTLASEAVLEPRGLDIEITDWNPEVLLKFVVTLMRLRLHRGSRFFFIFGTLRPYRNPEGQYSAFLGKATTGTCLDSHSAARKLATIEFLYCIILLHEVTDMLRGCWCGCYDPSARLRCFPRLEKHDLYCSLYFTVLLQ